MVLLDDIKLALRTNNVTETQDLIDAAKADLELSGVLSIVDTDPLIKRAITVYCKANYGYDEKAEKFQNSYNMLKSHLSLSLDYAYYKVTFTVTDSLPIPQATVTFNNEVKLTNQSGVASFYTKQVDNVEYSIYKNGYITQDYIMDVTDSSNIVITMVVA